MQLIRFLRPIDLQERMYATYISLRIGLGLLAFALPLVLVGWGYFVEHIPAQGSMSAYYFAFEPITSELRQFPMRGWFVGTLFAVGCFLYLYKGFSRTENIVLNIAGLSAVAVALFPMRMPEYCKNCGSDTFHFVHGFAAVTLFVCMAYVAWACIDETLVELEESKRNWFRSRYFLLAAAMLLAPIAAVALTFSLGINHWLVLIVEGLGIWTFAAYWLLKSYELSLSKADQKAMKGQRLSVSEAAAEKRSLRKRAARLLD